MTDLEAIREYCKSRIDLTFRFGRSSAIDRDLGEVGAWRGVIVLCNDLERQRNTTENQTEPCQKTNSN